MLFRQTYCLECCAHAGCAGAGSEMAGSHQAKRTRRIKVMRQARDRSENRSSFWEENATAVFAIAVALGALYLPLVL